MNRSVTIAFCAAVLWAAGVSDINEAGLGPHQDRRTEIGGSTGAVIPEIIGDYVLGRVDKYPRPQVPGLSGGL